MHGEICRQVAEQIGKHTVRRLRPDRPALFRHHEIGSAVLIDALRMLRWAADHRQSATESQGTIRAELRGKSGSSESRLSLQQKQHDIYRGNHNERHNQNLEKQSASFAGGSCRPGLSFRRVCHVEQADTDDNVLCQRCWL